MQNKLHNKKKSYFCSNNVRSNSVPEQKQSFKPKKMFKLLSHLEKYQIILASKSSRRQDLFKGLNIPFEIYPIEVDESFPPELIGMDIPMYLSKKKAEACTDIMKENTMLLTADTIVWYQGQVFGKPADRNEAKFMLTTLSGKTHDVITSVSITTMKKQRTFGVASEVRFARLAPEEIDFYLDNFQPYDKAGAYGVQEWIGFVGVEYINGSYYNVMGLPMQRLYNELKNWKE